MVAILNDDGVTGRRPLAKLYADNLIYTLMLFL